MGMHVEPLLPYVLKILCGTRKDSQRVKII